MLKKLDKSYRNSLWTIGQEKNDASSSLAEIVIQAGPVAQEIVVLDQTLKGVDRISQNGDEHGLFSQELPVVLWRKPE